MEVPLSQYILSVWHDEAYDLDLSREDAQRRVAQVGAFNSELMTSGALVFACRLRPIAEAEVLRAEAGTVVAIDGSFAEGNGHVGGFWIVEAEDLESARDIARRAAEACEASIELRALQAG